MEEKRETMRRERKKKKKKREKRGQTRKGNIHTDVQALLYIGYHLP